MIYLYTYICFNIVKSVTKEIYCKREFLTRFMVIRECHTKHSASVLSKHDLGANTQVELKKPTQERTL